MTYTRRLSWFLAVSVLQLTCLTAQKSSFWLELGVGHALENKKYFEDYLNPSASYLLRPGMTIGSQFRFDTKTKLSFSAGLTLEQRMNAYNQRQSDKIDQRLVSIWYVNLPASIYYRPFEKFSVGIAVSPGYFMLRTGRSKFEGKTENFTARWSWESKAFYYLFDLSSQVKIQYFPHKRIFIQSAFQYGLLPRLDKTKINIGASEDQKYRLHWQILQLSAGWRLNRT